mgnify:CR=1 FL=1
MENYSLSDIAAVTDGNRNNGGMFGGDWSAWIILFLLFGLFGGGWGGGFGGFGNGGGFGGAGFQGYATRADINEGFALNGITNGITAIQQGQKDMIYEMINAIKDCCCTTKQEIADVKYSAAKEACETRHMMSDSTRDIIENNNTNTRAILDFLTKNQIEELRSANQDLKFQNLLGTQSNFIAANNDAQTATLLRRLGAEYPSAAYLVNAPTPVNFPVNACGQVQFGGCGCGNGAYGYAA